MGQRSADAACGFRNGLGSEFLHGVERVAATFSENPDAIDDMLSAFDGAVDGVAVAQVCLHDRNLAEIALRLQVTGEIGAAYSDTDAVAALGKRAHDMPSDEA